MVGRRLWHLASLVLSSIVWHTFSTANSPVHWDPILRHYVDGEGRVRIFHGVNVVYKEAPWLPTTDSFNPQTSLTDKDMDLLQTWGFNSVRLGVMWTGVEPEHKNISHGYLQAAAKIVDGLGQRGVYTILDLHQDIGSRRFCGEGFPEYYMDDLLANPDSIVAKAHEFPAPLKTPLINSSKVPSIEDCLKNTFQDYYATYQVGALWRTLYEPGSALNSGFLRYWSAVAKEFMHSDNVLAYELLNEPSGWCIEGSCHSIPKLDNSIERKFLMPLYRAAASQIRQVDPKKIIFYEPTVYPKPGSLLGQTIFPEAVLGNDTQQGLAYHVYCEANDGAGIAADIECKLAQDVLTHEFYGYLDKFPVAGFMTEFGATSQQSGELSHLNRLFGFADERFQSWSYWQLKLYHDFTTTNHLESLYDAEGKLEMQKLRVLSRTYAQAVAGVPVRMHFDPTNAAFEFDFKPSAVFAATEIYLNEDLHYPNGYSIHVSPDGCVTTEHAKNLVRLHPLGKGMFLACVDYVVSVKILAKSAPNAEEVIV